VKLFEHYKASTGEGVFPNKTVKRMREVIRDATTAVGRISSCDECNNDREISQTESAINDLGDYANEIVESLDDAVGCCDDWTAIAQEIEESYTGVLERLGVVAVQSDADPTEIFQWCDDNVKGKWTIHSPFSVAPTYFFTDEKEAVMFKLRWGGDGSD
jgi:hypothetical protein